MNKLTDIITQPEYDFFTTNEHLAGQIMFVGFGGSHAYGTNMEGSDIDVRGVALNRPCDLIGLSNFEQFVDTDTDTVIYGFNKYINLILSCNPNTIEMLGLGEDNYAMLSKEGRLLIENRNLFLSKRAVHSFGGYANQQLRRLQVSVARNRVMPHQKGEFILSTCDTAMYSLESKYEIPHGVFKLTLSDTLDDKGEPVILILPDMGYVEFQNAKIPARRLNQYLSELSSIIKSYDSFGHRNQRAKEKSDKQLNKHAMHLVRLYLMVFDILERGEINTYRGNDLDFLMSIRNGVYMLEDGTYSDEFFEIISNYEKRLVVTAKESSLPNSPDMKKVEELVMEINKSVII